MDTVPDESDTTNNCSKSVQVTVPEPERPDLMVTAPSVSDSGPVTGAQFTLSATVRNDGNGGAAATMLRYYRSADATITASDTQVGTGAIAGIAASGSASESVKLTAPTTAGTYYYGACVDAVKDETDTTNNCSTSAQVTVQVTVTVPQGDPDLVVARASVSDGGPAAGARFRLSATVRNAGDGPAESTTLRFYRSSDATVTAADTQMGTGAIGALAATGSTSEWVELTAPSTPGMYYYGACVDAVTDETDATNNCSTSVPVVVPEPERADLMVGSPSVSDSDPATGAQFTLSATVRNDGNGAAASTTLRYYRSSDATIAVSDRQVGTAAIAALAASGSASESVKLTAPTTPGRYYYGACVDSVTDEKDTTNNCSTAVKVSTLQPDLVVGSPGVNESGPAAGAQFTLSAAVRNDGEGAAEATTLRYYRSTDATITTSDTQVGTDVVARLAASGSSRQSVEVTAPATAGTYYYGACVDAVTDESDATNNCSTSAGVTVPEPLSVEVSAEDDKEWAPVGDTVDLSARVLDEEGEEVTGATVTWSSSNTAVATVNSSGVMTAVGEGTVTLIATATVSGSSTQSSMTKSVVDRSLVSRGAVVKSEENVSASIDMEVVKRAARIEVTPDSLSFDEAGEGWGWLLEGSYGYGLRRRRQRNAADLLGLVIIGRGSGDGEAIQGGDGIRAVDLVGDRHSDGDRERKRDGNGIDIRYCDDTLGTSATLAAFAYFRCARRHEDSNRADFRRGRRGGRRRLVQLFVFLLFVDRRPHRRWRAGHHEGGRGPGDYGERNRNRQRRGVCACPFIRSQSDGETEPTLPGDFAGFDEPCCRRNGHPDGAGQGFQRSRYPVGLGRPGRVGGFLGDEQPGCGERGRRGRQHRSGDRRHRDGYRGRSRCRHDYGKLGQWQQSPYRYGGDNGDGKQLIGSKARGLGVRLGSARENSTRS